MRTSLIRRSLIAATTLAMVTVGSGIAGAAPGADPGADPDAARSSDVLTQMNLSEDVDLGGWDAAMSRDVAADAAAPEAAPDDAAEEAAPESAPDDAAPAAILADRQFRVNTTDDTTDATPGDGLCFDDFGDCSLRAAVQEANTSPLSTEVLLRNGNTYALDLDGSATDDAATGDLDIQVDLVLRGLATVDAADLGDRVLDVATGAALDLRGVTLVGGTPPTTESGGAVRTAGTTAVDRVTITGSIADGEGASGGAVFNAGGDLFVRRSTLSGNSATRAGGAIEANAGTTTIVDSELSGNMTGAMPGNGGGLHLTGAGTVDVRDSVVSGNTAALEGGGLWNSADGTMTVTDTTLSANTASGVLADNGGGALYNDGGSLTVDDTVISFNVADGDAGSGGGILNNLGTLTVTDSRLTGNTSNRAGGGIEANGGTTTIDDSRLAANATGSAPGNGGALHLTGAGQVDVTRTQVLRNQAAAEGGGLWNSVAGTMTVRDTSLRGNVASGPDATNGGGGLFNDGGTLTVMGSTLVDNVADGTSGSGGGILNDQGNLSVVDTRITSNDAQRAGGAIEANLGTTMLDGVTAASNTAGSNPGNGGALHLTGAGSVEVQRSQIFANTATAEGGGLWNSSSGDMVVRATTLRANVASGVEADQGGGALFNDGGSLAVSGSLLVDNVADGTSGSGGGILNNTGTIRVVDTRISSNDAQRAGGGVEAVSGDTTLDRVTLDANTAGPNPGNGGGLHLSGDGDVLVRRSRVTGNTAANEGGGLWNFGTGSMTVRDSTFRGNVASGDDATNGGGALFNDGGVLVVSGSQLVDNIADGAAGSGGGILNDQGDLRVLNTTISSNESQRAGGGIESNVGTTTLVFVTLSANVTGDAPGNGGGLHLTGAGTVVINRSDVVTNFAANEGGGLWNSSTGTMTVRSTTLRDNVAPVGPDVYNDGGTFTVDGQPVPVGG